MRYVRQEMKSKEDKFKVNNLLSKDPTDYPFPKIEEYFIYNPLHILQVIFQARGNSTRNQNGKRFHNILHIWFS